MRAMPTNARSAVRAFALVGVIFLAGCAGDPPLSSSGFLANAPVEPSLVEAKLQFHEGNFGKAIEAYSLTVERDPLNGEAWLGLAASYDQIGRYDLADKAYERVVSLVGETATVLNNIGYSHYLRGDVEVARTKLVAARSLAPDNRYVANNIELLNRKLVSLGEAPVNL